MTLSLADADYSDAMAYGHSKLANVLFSLALWVITWPIALELHRTLCIPE